MTNKFDIIFKTSGLLEKYNCSLDEFKELFFIWCDSMYSKEERERMRIFEDPSTCNIFIDMLCEMTGDYNDIYKVFSRQAQENEQYYFDIQVKKSAGTYDEWLREIQSENEKVWPLIENFFEHKKRQANPNSNFRSN